MPVGVGDPAPEFALEGTGGRIFTLSEFRGQPVVLVFYPGDDSPVCTKQLTTYNADLARFEALDAHVLAVSPQSIESHEEFRSRYAFGFPLLADVDKHVAALYGTLGPLGFARRSVFIVDAEGIIRYAHRAIAGLSFRPVDELVEQVEHLRR